MLINLCDLYDKVVMLSFHPVRVTRWGFKMFLAFFIKIFHIYSSNTSPSTSKHTFNLFKIPLKTWSNVSLLWLGFFVNYFLQIINTFHWSFVYVYFWCILTKRSQVVLGLVSVVSQETGPPRPSIYPQNFGLTMHELLVKNEGGHHLVERSSF